MNFSTSEKATISSKRLSISADKQEGGQIRVSGPISLDPGYRAAVARLSTRARSIGEAA